MTMITIGLAYRPVVTDAPPVTSEPEPAAIALDGYPRDRLVFDSGAARGANEATLPFAGHVEDDAGVSVPGVAVEGRLVPASGGTATAWRSLGTTDAEGRYEGAITSARRPDYVRREVRVTDAPAIRALSSETCGVGHVIALWGQSRYHQIISRAADQVAASDREAFGDGTAQADEMIQTTWHERTRNGRDTGLAGLRHLDLTAADHGTAALAALANVLMAARPGEKFTIVWQTLSGTGYRQMVNDGDAKRRWTDDALIHAHATGGGLAEVGIALTSWSSVPRTLGGAYVEALFPLFFKTNSDGSPAEIPGTIRYTNERGWDGATYKADHWFGELYDYRHTRWAFVGPHRQSSDNNTNDRDLNDHGPLIGPALHQDGTGATNPGLVERLRLSMRTIEDHPHAVDEAGDQVFKPNPLTPLSLRHSERDPRTGLWSDHAHASEDHPDGLMRHAKMLGLAALRAMDLVGWTKPVFDQCTWEASGAWVELGSSAGPVTTVRLARGLPPLPAEHHWTEVMGVTINGVSANRATIVDGRVRVLPNAPATAFTPDDVIDYGQGACDGWCLDAQRDTDAQTYLNTPIVDVGATGIEGLDVEPKPDPAVLVNTVGTGDGGSGDGSGSGTGDGDTGDGGSGGDTGDGDGGTGDGGTGDGDTGGGSGVVDVDVDTGVGVSCGGTGDVGSGDGGSGNGTGDGGTGDGGTTTPFTRGQANEPYFVDPEVGPGVAGLTVEIDAAIGVQGGTGGRDLIEVTGGVLVLKSDTRSTKRNVTLTLKAQDRTRLVNVRTPDGTLPTTRSLLRLSVVLDEGGTGTAIVSIDDAPLISETFTARDATFPAGREFRLLLSELPIEAHAIRVWHEALTTGGRPASAPFKEITGGPDAANADPWRKGGGAFT